MKGIFLVLGVLVGLKVQNGLPAKLPTLSSSQFPIFTYPKAAPSQTSFPAPHMSNMPRVKGLDVKCGRTAMNVDITFTTTFPGVIYSKGHFGKPECVYVKPKDDRSTVYRFTIPLDGCGSVEEDGRVNSQYTNSNNNNNNNNKATEGDAERVVGNTIIIQSDPVIQEVWDEARHITCSWSQSLVKSVNFKPIKVYEPKTVEVQLDSRAVNTLMEILQSGSGRDGAGGITTTTTTAALKTLLPSPPTGYVHVGEEVSLVMFVKGKHMDANVLSCEASRERKTYKSDVQKGIELVDGRGCLVRPDLLTPFAKTTETNGVEADLMLYSYLKNFNIQEVPEFSISCELELCENVCPKPCVGGNRRKRSENMVVRVDFKVKE